jgi:predicted DNA-binding protein with PD1-like motif
MHNTHRSNLETLTIRLKPGDDLKKFIDELATTYSLRAGIVLTCVGSLKKISIRYAGESTVTLLTGPHEIVSLTGTFSNHGSHLHLSVSDATGKTIGGHLKEGSAVYTTAELCLGILSDVVFTREKDETTGYPELMIRKQTP